MSDIEQRLREIAEYINRDDLNTILDAIDHIAALEQQANEQGQAVRSMAMMIKRMARRLKRMEGHQDIAEQAIDLVRRVCPESLSPLRDVEPAQPPAPTPEEVDHKFLEWWAEPMVPAEPYKIALWAFHAGHSAALQGEKDESSK